MKTNSLRTDLQKEACHRSVEGGRMWGRSLWQWKWSLWRRRGCWKEVQWYARNHIGNSLFKLQCLKKKKRKKIQNSRTRAITQRRHLPCTRLAQVGIPYGLWTLSAVAPKQNIKIKKCFCHRGKMEDGVLKWGYWWRKEGTGEMTHARTLCNWNSSMVLW